MRTSNGGIVAAGTLVLAASIVISGCGVAAATPPPSTPEPTPVVTPDPHLSAPASVDEILRLLLGADLRITPNTASTGANGEPVKRINATYAGWPLVLTQWSTAGALTAAASFDPGVPRPIGDAPYSFAGLNVQIEFGPHAQSGQPPATPDTDKRSAALELVAVLDPLLGPLTQTAVEPVPIPTATPLPAASPRPSVAASAPVATAAP